MLRLATTVVALMTVNACSSILQDPSAEQAARLTAGKSSRRDVLDLLGLPRKVRNVTLKDGRPGRAWIYFKGDDVRIEVVETKISELEWEKVAIVVLDQAGSVVEVQLFTDAP